jgi:hypothetical protein
MKTTRIPVERCAGCGEENDSASSGAPHTPKPGDLSICVSCGYLSVFTKDLRHRPLTMPELARASADPRVQAIQMARRQITRRK